MSMTAEDKWDSLFKMNPRQRLVKECNKLFSQAILKMFDGKCIRYSRSCLYDATEPHHIVTVGANPSLRHQIANAAAVCRVCHGEIHHDPAKFLEWLSVKSPRMYEWHRINKNHAPYISKADLRRTRSELKRFIKENK